MSETRDIETNLALSVPARLHVGHRHESKYITAINLWYTHVLAVIWLSCVALYPHLS